MEYVTVRGRKMKKIPDAEIQFFQLWVEGLMGHRKILDLEHDKYINRLSKKYDMKESSIRNGSLKGRGYSIGIHIMRTGA